MNIINKMALSAVAIAAVAVASHAQVNTVAQTITLNNANAGNFNINAIGSTLTPFGYDPITLGPDGSVNFTFKKFDTTGATFGLAGGGTYALTSIDFTVAGASQTTFSGSNTGTSAGRVSGSATATIVFNDPSNSTTLVTVLPTAYIAGNSVSPITTSNSIVVNGGASYGPLARNGSDTQSTNGYTANLGQFSTAGTANILSPVGANGAGLFANSGGNFNNSQTTSASATLQVVYHYNFTPTQTGVPEPSAVAFAMVAGAGLVGMMVRARRK